MTGLWRMEVEGEVGLDVRASVYGVRHRDRSVGCDIFKVNAICNSYSTTEDVSYRLLTPFVHWSKLEWKESLPAAMEAELVPQIDGTRLYKLLTR